MTSTRLRPDPVFHGASCPRCGAGPEALHRPPDASAHVAVCGECGGLLLGARGLRGQVNIALSMILALAWRLVVWSVEAVPLFFLAIFFVAMSAELWDRGALLRHSLATLYSAVWGVSLLFVASGRELARPHAARLIGQLGRLASGARVFPAEHGPVDVLVDAAVPLRAHPPRRGSVYVEEPCPCCGAQIKQHIACAVDGLDCPSCGAPLLYLRTRRARLALLPTALRAVSFTVIPALVVFVVGVLAGTLIAGLSFGERYFALGVILAALDVVMGALVVVGVWRAVRNAARLLAARALIPARLDRAGARRPVFVHDAPLRRARVRRAAEPLDGALSLPDEGDGRSRGGLSVAVAPSGGLTMQAARGGEVTGEEVVLDLACGEGEAVEEAVVYAEVLQEVRDG